MRFRAVQLLCMFHFCRAALLLNYGGHIPCLDGSTSQHEFPFRTCLEPASNRASVSCGVSCPLACPLHTPASEASLSVELLHDTGSASGCRSPDTQ
jgi:hypothetical protein